MFKKIKTDLCERCEAVGRKPAKAEYIYIFPDGTTAKVCKKCKQEIVDQELVYEMRLIHEE